ncbi:MAG: methyltransferase domain-containing protein [Actinomycetota bacterium]|nr:methyltransferase domain-containing protein [Actinomycetota bacterium]
MSDCCDGRGCDKKFGSRFARRTAKRYRRTGLDPTAARMVDFLAVGGLTGATVLEIGGGTGQIGIELLRRGASSVISLELSDAYDAEAMRLAQEAGVAGRIRRLIVDIAAAPETVQPADLVVLHRVVCCYPDYERLLGAAADHCRDRLAFSHPPRNVISRMITGAENARSALRREEFRTFVHPPEAMRRVLTERGLRLELIHRTTAWHTMGLVRAPVSVA